MTRQHLINLTLTEEAASFYLGLLKEYQRTRAKIDHGVAEDIRFLQNEMEMRGWNER